VSLVFCDRNVMLLGEGGYHERGDERGAPTLKRRYFTVIGSSNVKMVADGLGTDMLLHW